jgi:hypothetical protein
MAFIGNKQEQEGAAMPRRTARIILSAIALAPLPAFADPVDDFFSGWSERAHAALESQPHWIPPLNTITPRLTQVVRYDQYWQAANNGVSTNVFDAGKGVELIPFETTSLTINPALYDERGGKGTGSGWGDWPFLLIKQRLASAREDEGNYIATGFLSFQAPVGSAAFTNHAWVVTPGLGLGKGWGDFDIEANILAALPLERSSTIGTAITTNVIAQYHLMKYLWPEVELNNIAWSGGTRDGKDQLCMTIGTLLGNFPIGDNYAVGIGVGYQFALSPRPADLAPLTPTFDHNWILSLRLVY